MPPQTKIVDQKATSTEDLESELFDECALIENQIIEIEKGKYAMAPHQVGEMFNRNFNTMNGETTAIDNEETKMN